MRARFADKVRDVVRTIPKGMTMTYKEVATQAGNRKAARAVGAIMRANYDPAIPCHRVIGSDGEMRGYNRGGGEQKLRLLSLESVALSDIVKCRISTKSCLEAGKANARVAVEHSSARSPRAFATRQRRPRHEQKCSPCPAL